jgi:hypothetical protein
MDNSSINQIIANFNFDELVYYHKIQYDNIINSLLKNIKIDHSRLIYTINTYSSFQLINMNKTNHNFIQIKDDHSDLLDKLTEICAHAKILKENDLRMIFIFPFLIDIDETNLNSIKIMENSFEKLLELNAIVVTSIYDNEDITHSFPAYMNNIMAVSVDGQVIFNDKIWNFNPKYERAYYNAIDFINLFNKVTKNEEDIEDRIDKTIKIKNLKIYLSSNTFN